MIINEVWKPVKGFGTRYLLSNKGRLLNIKTNKYKKPQPDGDGYLKYCLYRKGKQYNKQIHRLVALHFIPNKFNKLQVNHIDGNKINNCVLNLEWVTPSENRLHAFKNGFIKKVFGAKHWLSKPVAQLNNKGSLIKIYKCTREAERITNVKYGSISDVLRGKRKACGGYKWIRL